MTTGQIIFRVHAVRRMAERGISIADIRRIIEADDVVEDYPDDEPYPSKLLLGVFGHQAIHVVAAFDRGTAIIVTAYLPDPIQWDSTYRRRREP